MLYNILSVFVTKHFFSWWYGKTSRAEAERILRLNGGDGSFLVRDSEANPGNKLMLDSGFDCTS